MLKFSFYLPLCMAINTVGIRKKMHIHRTKTIQLCMVDYYIINFKQIEKQS